MKRFKQVPMLILTVLTLCLASVPAFAHDVPDPSRTGTIAATMTYDDERVAGGLVTLYRVGDVVSDDGNYGFELSGIFAQSGVSIDDLESADAAADLAAYAEDHGASGVTQAVASDGTVVFSNVEIGLYLMVQSEPADGYHAFDPFLVGMPLTEDGAYVYEIDASPKLELEKAPVPPEEPEKPQKPSDLPETGENFGPMIAVLGAGIVAVAIGLGLRARKRDAE